MTITDNYEINVAKDRKHFCKIQLSDCFEVDAEAKLEFFRKLFGDEYHVTMTHWTCRGESHNKWL